MNRNSAQLRNPTNLSEVDSVDFHKFKKHQYLSLFSFWHSFCKQVYSSRVTFECGAKNIDNFTKFQPRLSRRFTPDCGCVLAFGGGSSFTGNPQNTNSKGAETAPKANNQIFFSSAINKKSRFSFLRRKPVKFV